jgi:predicted nucleotidyltransferase
MDLPPDVARLLSKLRDELIGRGGLVGVYVYGSLATGDFSPAASDIDVVVMLTAAPDPGVVSQLTSVHERLSAGDPAAQLHCLYVAADQAGDPERLCPYWYGDQMTQWRLKLMTQAELLAAGEPLYGPWPPPGIGPVAVADLQAAVRGEISGYWRRAARKRKRWLQDTWVDHGLVVLPRAAALLRSGEFISKSEAISRLGEFGVPAPLAGEIRDRRDGQAVVLTFRQRLLRAYRTRRIMRQAVHQLGDTL